MKWQFVSKRLFGWIVPGNKSRKFFPVCFLLLVSLLLQTGLAAAQSESPVTIEVRYKMPAAGEVSLVWGVNEWQTLPEGQRPAGTTINDKNIMLTPMTREGDEFIAKVYVPALTVVNFGFLITKASDGSSISPTWDGGDGYWLAAPEKGQALSIESKVALSNPEQSAGGSNSNRVNQIIKLVKPEAGEVSLIWGINGWNPAPENLRPEGTRLENKMLVTPLKKEGDYFYTSLQLPVGTVVDFGFLTTKDNNGTVVNVWEANGSDDYHLKITKGGIFEAGKYLQSQGQSNRSRLVLFIGGFLVLGLVIFGGAAFLYKRMENRRLETLAQRP